MPHCAGKYLHSLGKGVLFVLIFFRCALSFDFAAERPQYRFDSWTTDNGLPQISVNSILQTRDGFLWFATFGGLVRYDGLRFEIFNTGNTKELKTSRFISLFEDNEANLWITTEGQGIALYKNGKFMTFTTENGLLNNQIERIGKNESGNLLIQTDGRLMSWNGEKFYSYSPADDAKIKPILQWKQNGDLWIQDGEKLQKIENGRATIDLTPGFRVRRLFEDSANRLWFAPDKDVLTMFSDGKWTTFTEKDGYPYFTYNVAFEDDQKNLWFGTRGGGLVLFKDGKFTRYTAEDGLAGNNITYIFQDREGILWIGTGSGLSRMQEQAVTAYSAKDGLAADNVYPIYQDRQGRIWIGSWKGLTIYENNQFQDIGKRFSVENDEIMSFLEDRDGNFWIGTWGGGVKLVKNDKVTVFPSTELPGTRVRVLYQDHLGNIWFGTADGLVKTKSPEAAAERKAFTVYKEKDGFSGKGVMAILEDRSNQLWIGTESGLFKYTDGSFTKYTEADGFKGGIVRSIYEDDDGVLWVGMYDSGIYRIKNERLIHYTTVEGLYDNGAFRIIEDSTGNFWISSNVGIYRVKKSDLNDLAEEKVRHISSILYNKRDGMLNSECNGGGQPAGIKAKDGRLWFPTQNGVAVINPETVPLNTQPPPVVIESFIVDTKPVEKISPIQIQPEQVYFEIHYSGLSFIQPELVRFKYKLEGLDDDWTDAGTRRTAYFSHLPPGTYLFRVLAANRDGVWNEQGASLEIIVLPPFYKTWLFRVSATIVVMLIIFLIYRQRIKRLKEAQTAQETFSRQLIESQETERRRIAAELHDSLGQSLVLIRNWALLGLRGTEDKARTNLDEISETASEAIKEVREIAYNLGPYQLERLGLRNTIEEMVQKVGDTSKTEFYTEIGEINECFPKEAEINVFRIVQEAVNNVIKHSGASRANLKIEAAGEEVILTIEDDGKGFAAGGGAAASNGFGLLGMNERVRLLKGNLIIDSEVGRGTTVKATLPCREK